jgi:hypothetical protein
MNQAGWRCEDCRKNGLDVRRRCGWLKESQRGPSRLVWARKSAHVESCPKSLITAESESLVGSFWAWKLLGGCGFMDLPAKTADAFCVLENELRAEVNDGTK